MSVIEYIHASTYFTWPLWSTRVLLNFSYPRFYSALVQVKPLTWAIRSSLPDSSASISPPDAPSALGGAPSSATPGSTIAINSPDQTELPPMHATSPVLPSLQPFSAARKRIHSIPPPAQSTTYINPQVPFVLCALITLLVSPPYAIACS
ncbi:hypothetical protein PIB30_004968 [Stylosanthes scabra]|uniref:Uncharacterized protein n=1 Tax=Stylosanthes scabra TaxID=79078 RepID=A0ABU6X3M8_9FABA|nr:hypothetical protein [Stylosanthes scabra]